MYRPLPESVTIGQSLIEGLGLFAKENIKANTCIGMTHVYDERFPDNYIRLPLGGFFNHSDTPNCKVVYEDSPYKHISLTSLRDINIGEELTAYYTLYIPENKKIQNIIEKLELRMYGLVIYQLSPIQAGIQFQHSVTRYGRVHDSEIYRDWADNWRTSIVLNGGTTNLNPNKLGTINKYLQKLQENGIVCQPFYEPDLGEQLTSIAFIVDERVFNKKKYPDFGFDYDEINDIFIRNGNFGQRPTKEWIDSIGGQKNIFLRYFLDKLTLWK